ncbi:MAG TPA: hypothetical protein VK642_06305 [Burkholderiales bacterium]|nr:hypothetical protein [Burkholderiales bacterium]
MPSLNTLIEVGFCLGYGDGDYRVSGAIGELSRERFNELMVTHLWAIKCAQEMWLKAQPQPQAAQAGSGK